MPSGGDTRLRLFITAGPSTNQRQYLTNQELLEIPQLRPESRIRELGNVPENNFGYTHNFYITKRQEISVPIVWHEGQFHRFYHDEQAGRPYLGPVHREATIFETQRGEDTTDDESIDELNFQLRTTSISVEKGAPGSPYRTKLPDLTPIQPPAVRIFSDMVTEMISKTLTQPEPETAKELAYEGGQDASQDPDKFNKTREQAK